MNAVAHELMLGDVYYSPVLLLITLSFLITGVISILLNKLKLSKYIYHPPTAYLAIMVIVMVGLDFIWIKV